MSEFKWLTMCNMIDIKKRKFLEKFSISENSLCQVIVHCVIRDSVLYSLCRDIVFLCSFPFILVKGSFFSILYYQIGEQSCVCVLRPIVQ